MMQNNSDNSARVKRENVEAEELLERELMNAVVNEAARNRNAHRSNPVAPPTPLSVKSQASSSVPAYVNTSPPKVELCTSSTAENSRVTPHRNDSGYSADTDDDVVCITNEIRHASLEENNRRRGNLVVSTGGTSSRTTSRAERREPHRKSRRDVVGESSRRSRSRSALDVFRDASRGVPPPLRRFPSIRDAGIVLPPPPAPPAPLRSEQPKKEKEPSKDVTSFAKWTNPRGELVLRKVADVGIGFTVAPLGCMYDEELGFLFTAYDQIRSCSETGEMTDTIVVPGLNNPSALCPIKTGESFAILDYHGIHVYDVASGTLSPLVERLKGRGLVCTKDGLIVTIVETMKSHSICLYDTRHKNRLVASIPFPTVPGSLREKNPSFCGGSLAHSIVYITDLFQNGLVAVNTAGGVIRVNYVRSLSVPAVPAESAFQFPSGIVTDSRYEILVADATAKTLWWLTSHADGGQRVRVVGGSFPYCSGLAVSPSGYLMACARQANMVTVYKFVQEDVDETGEEFPHDLVDDKDDVIVISDSD